MDLKNFLSIIREAAKETIIQKPGLLNLLLVEKPERGHDSPKPVTANVATHKPHHF